MTKKIPTKILYLPNYDKAEWGELRYEHATDSAFDLRSCEDIVIEPGARASVRCGVKIQFPEGYGCTIRPRSGNAIKLGLSMPNSLGTMDNGFLGEWCQLLINLGAEPIRITRGMRIGQCVIEPIFQADFTEILNEDEFAATDRADNGFGSTGTH